MKTLSFALALCSLPACLGQDAPPKAEGIVTIFREHPTSRMKMMSMQDQWPNRLHKKLTLDGAPLLDMHGGEFASFKLPAGRHSIQWEKYGGPTADFDLHAGERVFIHPGFAGGQFFEAAKLTLSIMPCDQALQLGKDTAPMEAKNILKPGVLSEASFPTTCETR